jgi:hypothetical protein
MASVVAQAHLSSKISLQILYGQLAVYRPEVAQLNLWTDDDIDEGFVWSEGNVSFAVPDHDGRSIVEVDFRTDRVPLAHDCIHAVEVPLLVGDAGVTLATLLEEIPLPLSAGLYSLRFELQPGTEHDGVQHQVGIRLTFVPDPRAGVSILKRRRFKSPASPKLL